AKSTQSYGMIYRTLLKLSIPISLASLSVSLIYFIDNSTLIMLLESMIGYDQAKETLGILTGKAQSLAGIPPILASALGLSIIPIISGAFARNDQREVDDKSSLALRITLLSGIP